jgi:kynurenine formamidase
VNTDKGCAKLGIDNLKQGIVTRGVLLDIPRLKNLPYLEPGTPVFVEDIEAWEKKANVKVSPGDVILLRTGRWARRAKLGPWNVGQNEAGYHASIAPWLKERGVSFLTSDVAQDVTPSLVPGINLPVHTLAITALGIDIMDNLDLEQLAETAARLNRWEFLFMASPVPVTGGTGFPANPLAIF